MYELIDLGQNKYEFTTTSYGSKKGTLLQVVQFAHFDLDLSYKEIEFALVEMNKAGHNAAHFGVFGSFIFSYTKELANVA